MAVASSASMLAVASAAGLGWQRTMGPDQVGNSACSARLSIPLGGALPVNLTNRKLQYMCGSLFGGTSLMHQQFDNHLRVLHAQSSPSGQSTAARAEVGTVTKEQVTGIAFSNAMTSPGASTELSLVGTGVREKQIAFLKVKVYAVGFYIDASTVADSPLGAWKGMYGSELSNDGAFFQAMIEAPVVKALQIVLARDVDGAQFWEALDEALSPRLKAARAGLAGQEALASFGNAFRDRSLKKGTTVFLTWSQPAVLQIAISAPPRSSNSAAADATINSATLLSCLFDVYLGPTSVSPSLKTSVANGFPSLV